VDQLWLVRLDAGTANLAEAYDAILANATAALGVELLFPRAVVVADLATGETVAVRVPAFSGESWFLAPLADELRGAAGRAAGHDPTCTSAGLGPAGASLGWIVGERPAGLLVGILDHRARPYALGDPACGDPVAEIAGSEVAAWTGYVDGPLASRRVLYGFVGTSEVRTLAEERSHCLATSGFPPRAADVVEPSANAFLDPWATSVEALLPGIAGRYDLCEAVASRWSAGRAPLRAWATRLREP
jgi:hypothetical protein